MLKLYIKQAIKQLQEHPLFALISILGTALSITMIMTVVSVYQITNGDYQPEANRSRTLYIKSLMLQDGGNFSASSWGLRLAKECFSPLKTPEEVSFVSNQQKALIETTDHSKKSKGDYVFTDAAFWNIFKFRFIEGKPFTQDDGNGNTKRVVISASIARHLFQSTHTAIGEPVLIGRTLYSICGVVEDVSPLATTSYAQAWIPYPTTNLTEVINEETKKGMNGNFRILLLARSHKDLTAIRNEVEQRVNIVNEGLQKWTIDLLGQPDNFFTYQQRIWMNSIPDVSKMALNYIIMILILLLVPAINLSGLSASSIQYRSAELGVRKAFGATNKNLFFQLLSENFIITLLGGIVGLVCSYMVIIVVKEKLFGSFQLMSVSSDISLTTDMLFQPVIFIYALLSCFVLNLLSTGIPAWNATQKPIVHSLKQELV